MNKYLIVTADDFGLSREISEGIIASHLTGIVTSTSMLVNAPWSENAQALLKEAPRLEVGLHLSLVEGYSLRRIPGRLTSSYCYFAGNDQSLCLHSSWREFLRFYLLGSITPEEIEEELEAQIRRFCELRDDIPFVNVTQHLHFLPGVLNKVVALCHKYRIRGLRLPSRNVMMAGHGTRRLQGWILGNLSRMARWRGLAKELAKPDSCVGFEYTGRLDESSLARILASLPDGVTELMVHPGYDCPSLRNQLPRSYGTFDWESELRAVTSPAIRMKILESNAKLIKFSDLPEVL